jgi:hypothetical protein
MDESAFLPLSQRELTEVTPGRLEQYATLVDKLVEVGRDKGLCSTVGLQVRPSRGGYGRYIRIGDQELYVQVDAVKWHQFGCTC